MTVSLADNDPEPHESPVPTEWTVQRDFTCTNGTLTRMLRSRGSVNISYSMIRCDVVIRNANYECVYKDYTLMVLIVLINFFTCLGAQQPPSLLPSKANWRGFWCWLLTATVASPSSDVSLYPPTCQPPRHVLLATPPAGLHRHAPDMPGDLPEPFP